MPRARSLSSSRCRAITPSSVRRSSATVARSAASCFSSCDAAAAPRHAWARLCFRSCAAPLPSPPRTSPSDGPHRRLLLLPIVANSAAETAEPARLALARLARLSRSERRASCFRSDLLAPAEWHIQPRRPMTPAMKNAITSRRDVPSRSTSGGHSHSPSCCSPRDTATPSARGGGGRAGGRRLVGGSGEGGGVGAGGGGAGGRAGATGSGVPSGASGDGGGSDGGLAGVSDEVGGRSGVGVLGGP